MRIEQYQSGELVIRTACLIQVAAGPYTIH